MVELHVKELSSIVGKGLGLLTSKKAKPVLMRTRFGIHTFGMRFPIDVIILDRNNNVVALKRNLKPNRIFLWVPVFDQVIELPEGDIEKHKIQHGERIRLTIQE